MKNPNLLFLLMAILLSSCAKIVDAPPQIKVWVVDEEQMPVTHVTIKLFETLEDWESDTNWVRKAETGNENFKVFLEMEEKKYFIHTQKDSMNNTTTMYELVSPLQINELAEVTVTIK